jgi:V/A-type H+-transporting ATPase subunit E
MAIEDILRRIDEEAEAEIRGKLDEARREAASVEAEYAREAERLEAELRLRAEKRSREEERRLIVSEQLEIRKASLTKKQAILDALYEKALRRIEELPRAKYRGIIASLIVERAVSGAEEIVVGKKHRDLFDDAFLAELSEAYPGGGRFTRAPEEGDFEWGVVLREGRRAVDLTLEVLFEQLRERIEPRIAAVMFPAVEGRKKD